MFYARECKESLKLNYGFQIKVLMRLCYWVQATTCGPHATLKKYQWGFTLVHFKRLFSTWEQPFTFVSRVEKVFFIDPT